MRLSILLFSLSFIFWNCTDENSAKHSSSYMDVTHYYSIKYENDIAVRDTLKNCFSCNQAKVYDENNRLVELRFYQSNMKDLFGYETYSYNENDHRSGSVYFDTDSATTRYEYELDEQGRIMGTTAYSIVTDERLYGTINEYDDSGNHISTGSLNADSQIVDYYVRTFNKYGIAVTENITDPNGNPTFRVRYEYRPTADSSWVEQLTYYNDVLREIRIRERIEL